MTALHPAFVANGNDWVLISGGQNIWEPPIYGCPYCGEPCEADHVDVGVGLMQCGPYHCTACGAGEIHAEDGRPLEDVEKVTGFYLPDKPPSPLANTVDGVLVDHKTAMEAYRRGELDIKPDPRLPVVLSPVSSEVQF